MVRPGILFALAAGVLAIGTAVAEAAVARLEIASRAPFADGRSFGETGAYEVIRGRIHYAIDPRDPANAAIVDLDLAPTDADGMATFAGDFVLLAPVEGGNGRLLYEVNNRGNLAILPYVNDAPFTNDPRTLRDAGNRFLMTEGYTLLWSAWNWDVLPGNRRLQIDLPVAMRNGETITGTIAAEIVVDAPAMSRPVAWGSSRGYETVDVGDPNALLTVRDAQDARRHPIARDKWRFARADGGRVVADPTHVHLEDGFEPGRIYEVVYTAKAPRVVGLGLAAIRDALAFFRYEEADPAGTANPLAAAGLPEAALIFGISQSGRVIQHMLYEGLHVDPAGRPAFDAAFIHVAGGGKGSFNHRFAQTTRHPSEHHDHQYPADFFPFTTVPQTDPVTGETGDVLAEARAAGHVPYLFYTNGATEYWTRSASLIHTDAAGETDAGVDPKARVYTIAGAQHGPVASPDRGIYRYCGNPLDYRPVLRALLLRLDRWATVGEAPPDSRYPRIADGGLGTVAEYRAAFPSIPGVDLPAENLAPPRLGLGLRYAGEGIIAVQPPAFGPPYGATVPLPDVDGIAQGGIRLPEVALPLGTYVGWNLRAPEAGAEDALARWSGSFFPFAPDAATREAENDPRPSIAERYPNAAAYRERTFVEARKLARDGFLLERDVHLLVGKAGRIYGTLAGGAVGEGCGYLRYW